MSRIIKNADGEPDAYLPYERATLELYAPGLMIDGAGDLDGLTARTLVDVEAQKEALLEEARAEAERKVQEAYAEGLRRGAEAGRQEYLDAAGKSVEALQATAEEMKRAHQELLDRMQEDVTGLVRAVLQRLLRRETWADLDAVRRTLRAVLEALADREEVIVHMNPRDLEALNREAIGFLDSFEGVYQKELIPDESIAPGGCTVETPAMYVDAQLDAQIERILDQLSEIQCEPPESQ